MKPEEILSVVDGIPHTTPRKGRIMYDFIIENRLKSCLELGFAHGVGTVWIGGAAQELGGRLVSVDNLSAKERQPSAFDLVTRAGLENVVELHCDPISYTWHLQRTLKSYAANQFDFIFIDGPHTWDVDGFAFFLCERILKPGGWILFDDMDWCYADSPAGLAKRPDMTEEERSLKQVRKIWDELVITHPSFGNFRDADGWGWAQKSDSVDAARELRISHDFTSPLKKIAHSLGLR